jgi:hypothetical protein
MEDNLGQDWHKPFLENWAYIHRSFFKFYYSYVIFTDLAKCISHMAHERIYFCCHWLFIIAVKASY